MQVLVTVLFGVLYATLRSVSAFTPDSQWVEGQIDSWEKWFLKDGDDSLLSGFADDIEYCWMSTCSKGIDAVAQDLAPFRGTVDQYHLMFDTTVIEDGIFYGHAFYYVQNGHCSVNVTHTQCIIIIALSRSESAPTAECTNVCACVCVCVWHRRC